MSELFKLLSLTFLISCLDMVNLVAQPTFNMSVGTSGTGNGEFSQPNGIAVHPFSGDIYVADRNNERVQIFSSSGIYQSQFGTSGTGNGQFASNNGCVDLAFDGSGNVWVIDRANHRVQQFNSAGVYLSQFGSSGAGNGEFSQPNGIAVHPSSGDIYVADRNNERVQIFSSSGIYQSQFGTLGTGNGQFASNNGCVDLGFASGSMVWVVDRGNHRIQQFMEASLPVEFALFDVYLEENTVHIEWQTRSEQNNHYFEVERSDNGFSWETLQRVQGAGTSLALKDYKVVDPIKQAGTYYYRLRQVDLNGRFFFSEIRLVNVQSIGKTPDIFSNPASDKVTVVSKAEDIDFVTFFDMYGNDLTAFVQIAAQAPKSLCINLETLPEGVYFLKTGSYTSKIFVRKN